MIYKPIAAVWEITMGCNLRCRHCGSSCAKPLPDELSTFEALKLCDDLAELGMEWVSLSGGEPTTRVDWDQIVQRLADNGVKANPILDTYYDLAIISYQNQRVDEALSVIERAQKAGRKAKKDSPEAGTVPEIRGSYGE